MADQLSTCKYRDLARAARQAWHAEPSLRENWPDYQSFWADVREFYQWSTGRERSEFRDFGKFQRARTETRALLKRVAAR